MNHNLQSSPVKSMRGHISALLATAALLAVTASAEAAEFPPNIDLGALGSNAGVRFSGVDAGDQSGFAVSTAGDFNGDGVDDVIIGAHNSNAGGANSGVSYLVFGKRGFRTALVKLADLNGRNGFRLVGAAGGDQSGGAVATGDFNGDGIGDLLIGADGADRSGRGSGTTYVVFGRRGSFSSSLSLGSLNGKNGFKINGENPFDRSGRAVASAGDINGDGIEDILVGAPSEDSGGKTAGAAYVVFGKKVRGSANIGLGGLNGDNGFKMLGGNTFERTGRAVAGAGDVNGDGVDDFIVGAYGAAPNGSASGASYVVFGKTSGFAANISLLNLNGSDGFILNGVATIDRSGRAVGGGGDVNGDGFSDVIVGAPFADPFGSESGSSYVVFGKSSFGSPIELSTLDGNDGFRVDGRGSLDRSGRSLAMAGDVNSDGYGDMIIAAPLANANGADSGASYVLFGKASGFTSIISVSALNGTNGFKISGAAADDGAGRWVAPGGDFNGDGFSDVIVGAFQADTGANNAGKSYVVFGRAPDAAANRTGGDANQYISGGAFVDNLQGVDGDDVLEGRAGGDTLSGGAGDNTASYAHAPAGVVASLQTPASNTGHALGDGYTNIQNLVGSPFGDRLTGDAGTNRLTGGFGKDRMNGGDGPDTFAYRIPKESRRGRKRDVISQFDSGTTITAVDIIDLSKIDANSKVGGDQPFKFIGGKRFSKKAGQLRTKGISGGVIVQADVNGDGRADLEIQVTGVGSSIALRANDFKL